MVKLFILICLHLTLILAIKFPKNCEFFNCPPHCELTVKEGCPHNCNCTPQRNDCPTIHCPFPEPRCVKRKTLEGCHECACEDGIVEPALIEPSPNSKFDDNLFGSRNGGHTTNRNGLNSPELGSQGARGSSRGLASSSSSSNRFIPSRFKPSSQANGRVLTPNVWEQLAQQSANANTGNSRFPSPNRPHPTVAPTVVPRQPIPRVFPTVTPRQPIRRVFPTVAPRQPIRRVFPTAAPRLLIPQVFPPVVPRQPKPPVSPPISPRQPFFPRQPVFPVAPQIPPRQPTPPVTSPVIPRQPISSSTNSNSGRLLTNGVWQRLEQSASQSSNQPVRRPFFPASSASLHPKSPIPPNLPSPSPSLSKPLPSSPRSIALPTKVKPVGVGQSVTYVIASDGSWNVVDNDRVPAAPKVQINQQSNSVSSLSSSSSSSSLTSSLSSKLLPLSIVVPYNLTSNNNSRYIANFHVSGLLFQPSRSNQSAQAESHSVRLSPQEQPSAGSRDNVPSSQSGPDVAFPPQGAAIWSRPNLPNSERCDQSRISEAARVLTDPLSVISHNRPHSTAAFPVIFHVQDVSATCWNYKQSLKRLDAKTIRLCRGQDPMIEEVFANFEAPCRSGTLMNRYISCFASLKSDWTIQTCESGASQSCNGYNSLVNCIADTVTNACGKEAWELHLQLLDRFAQQFDENCQLNHIQ